MAMNLESTMLNRFSGVFFCLFAIFSISSAQAQDGNGLFDYESGGADAPVTGAASSSGASKAAPSLEKCNQPFGTIAVVEPQDHLVASLAQYNLPPPNGLLRLMIQQSACFQVVERGLAMQNLIQERQLSGSGQLQAGSNIGQGQLVVADFLLTPNVTFSEEDSGGAAIGAISNLFGTVGNVIGAFAGEISFKQAQTTLLLADSRSGLQVAAAEGNVEKTDWNLSGAFGGSGGAAGGGAYTNTAEGKVITAALLDNYNNIIRSIRNQPSLIQPRASNASQQNASASIQANAFNAGDILRGKIGGIKILTAPDPSAKLVFRLQKNQELVFLGDEKNGYLNIQGADGEGWVDKRLIQR